MPRFHGTPGTDQPPNDEEDTEGQAQRRERPDNGDADPHVIGDSLSTPGTDQPTGDVDDTEGHRGRS